MKYLPFLIILLSTPIFAQTNPIGPNVTSKTPVPIVFGVSVAPGTVNGKPTKIMQIIFDGDIELYINKIKLSLGNEEIKTDGKIINSIVFKNFQKPEWSENKIILNFESTTNINRNFILITCFDSKGNDLLEFDNQSHIKIKTYFESLLPK